MQDLIATNAARPLAYAPALADLLGKHAVEALIDEVTLAPKPGLVDIRSRGAPRRSRLEADVRIGSHAAADVCRTGARGP